MTSIGLARTVVHGGGFGEEVLTQVCLELHTGYFPVASCRQIVCVR